MGCLENHARWYLTLLDRLVKGRTGCARFLATSVRKWAQNLQALTVVGT
jgi:hypothetical protein